MLRLIVLCLVMICTQGCSIFQSTPLIGTDELNRHIAKNAEILSTAHADATNAIILQNVLRARDRWPTSYTTVSGIKAEPNVDFTAGGTFSPLGLGNPPTPFGESSANFEQKSTSGASYSVSPFATKNGSQGLLEPIPPKVFARYWNAGWPRDVLLLVMASDIEVGGKVTHNDADKPLDFIKAIAPFLGKKECAELLAVNGREVSEINDLCKWSGGKYADIKYQFAPNMISNEDNCPKVASYAGDSMLVERNAGKTTLTEQISQLKEINGGDLVLNENEKTKEFEVRLCKSLKKQDGFILKPIAFKVQNDATGGADDEDKAFHTNFKAALSDPKEIATAKLTLRSIDSAVYYVGEWLRAHGDNFKDRNNNKAGFVMAESECKQFTHTGGSTKGKDGTPDQSSNGQILDEANRLFSVFEDSDFSLIASAKRDDFAAHARHAGDDYSAVRRYVPNASGDGKNCKVDRTGTVMSLLTQLYLRSQSDDFLKAPASNVLRTQ